LPAPHMDKYATALIENLQNVTSCLTNKDAKRSTWPYLICVTCFILSLVKGKKWCIMPHIIVQIGLPVDGVCIHSPPTRLICTIGCETWSESAVEANLPQQSLRKTLWATNVRYFAVYGKINWIWHEECQAHRRCHSNHIYQTAWC